MRFFQRWPARDDFLRYLRDKAEPANQTVRQMWRDVLGLIRQRNRRVLTGILPDDVERAPLVLSVKKYNRKNSSKKVAYVRIDRIYVPLYQPAGTEEEEEIEGAEDATAFANAANDGGDDDDDGVTGAAEALERAQQELLFISDIFLYIDGDFWKPGDFFIPWYDDRDGYQCLRAYRIPKGVKFDETSPEDVARVRQLVSMQHFSRKAYLNELWPDKLGPCEIFMYHLLMPHDRWAPETKKERHQASLSPTMPTPDGEGWAFASEQWSRARDNPRATKNPAAIFRSRVRPFLVFRDGTFERPFHRTATGAKWFTANDLDLSRPGKASQFPDWMRKYHYAVHFESFSGKSGITTSGSIRLQEISITADGDEFDYAAEGRAWLVAKDNYRPVTWSKPLRDLASAWSRLVREDVLLGRTKPPASTFVVHGYIIPSTVDIAAERQKEGVTEDEIVEGAF